MGDINQEPSMEEILASIKRVIAEDGRSAGAPRGRSRRSETDVPPDPEVQATDEDVLELDEPLVEEGLLSPDTAAASRQSLAQLAALRQQEEPADAGDGPLEAVVREMLRPMLKEWLEQRLPDMVEEMVSREIARITGKRL